MRAAPAPVLAARPIDTSQVVRQIDPQASRDLLLLLGLVALLVGGLVLYAWPSARLQRIDARRELLSRERERLLEEGRQLRLEKAALEDLRRIEAIATRDPRLGLISPPPGRVIVVERARALPAGAQLASGAPTGAGK